MFCPNCGNQNAESAQNCAKCNFALKSGAPAPKFKGTMLMVNQGPGAPPPAPPAPEPPKSGPSKLKGTMVGVAPPVAGLAPPNFGPSAPPAYGAPPAGGVNPLAGTLAADQPAFLDPYAATTAEPQQQWGAPPAAAPGGYGAPPAAPGGFGDPAQQQQQQWGAPPAPAPGGYGAPPAAPGGFGDPAQQQQQWGAPPAPAPGGYGAPPAAPGGFGDPAQQQQQQWGAPPAPAPGGYGDPAQQQQQWGAPPAAPGGYGAPAAAPGGYGAPAGAGGYGAPPAGGAMVPYGGDPNQGQYGQQGFGGGGGGAGGAKGQVRAPITVLLMCMFIPFYSLIHMFSQAGEINGYLGRDAFPVIKVLLLGMVTCGLYAIYWRLTQYGAIIQEVQQRAGIPNPVNHGFMYLIPIYNIMLAQEELNKAWSAPG